MTQRAGGYASVRVDPKNRLVDGDTSGDLYAGLEQALRQKLEPPIVILAAERQVVAGLNWRILVQSGDNRYEAVILQKLPCHGGEFVLTDFKPAAQPPPDRVSRPANANGNVNAKPWRSATSRFHSHCSPSRSRAIPSRRSSW